MMTSSDLLEARFREMNPDDPVPPRAGSRSRMENLEDNKFNRPLLHIARDEHNFSNAIGWTSLYLTHPDAPDYEESKHRAYGHVFVLKKSAQTGHWKAVIPIRD